MPYVTVYEITHEAIPLWIPFSFPIIAVFAGIFILGSRGTPILRTVIKSGVVLFACLWVSFVAYTFRYQSRLVHAYQAGNYKVVEGPVEHYSRNGKHECFSVRSMEFCHGTANAVGWVPPLRFGPTTWPVDFLHDGLPARVAYSPGEYPHIFRLEVTPESR